MLKANFEEKIPVLPLRHFRLLYYPGILQRLQHVIIQLPLFYLLVVAYERWSLTKVSNEVIWPRNVWCFGKLVAYERWSQPEV